MKIGVCQETARFWRSVRHTARLSVLEVRVHEDHVGPRGGRPVQELATAPHGHHPIPQRLEHAVERLVEPRAGVRESTTGERLNGMRGGMARECGYDDAGRNRQNPSYVRR